MGRGFIKKIRGSILLQQETENINNLCGYKQYQIGLIYVTWKGRVIGTPADEKTEDEHIEFYENVEEACNKLKNTMSGY